MKWSLEGAGGGVGGFGVGMSGYEQIPEQEKWSLQVSLMSGIIEMLITTFSWSH